jgi:hypothetical protein
MPDTRLEQMNPGQVLVDARLPDIIEQIGQSIAAAQMALDATGVRIATMLSETQVTFTDAEGESSERSLLELGFTPTFYHFSETDIELKMTVSLRIEKGHGFKTELDSAEAPNRIMPFGANVSLEYHQKFNFDITASSTIRTKMKAVPAPQVFLEAIRDNAAGGGSISTNGGDGDGA